MKISEMPEFEREMLTLVRGVSTTIMQMKETVQPFAIVQTDTSQIYVPGGTDGVDWNGAADDVIRSKHRFALLVRASALANDATAVGFASEAWVVKLDTPEKAERFQKWRKENPERSFEEFEGHVEVIIIQLETEEGRYFCNIQVHRAANNAPWLDEISDEDEVHFEKMGTPEWVQTATTGHMSMFYAPHELRSDRLKQSAVEYLKKNGAELKKLDDSEPKFEPNPHAN